MLCRDACPAEVVYDAVVTATAATRNWPSGLKIP